MGILLQLHVQALLFLVPLPMILEHQSNADTAHHMCYVLKVKVWPRCLQSAVHCLILLAGGRVPWEDAAANMDLEASIEGRMRVAAPERLRAKAVACLPTEVGMGMPHVKVKIASYIV
jgi:hypothetical protein